MSNTGSRQRELLIFPVAIVVMVAFLGALFQAMVEREYTALTIVTPLMVLLAGFAFGTGIIHSVTGGSREKD
jgi:hypothetical protein